jgi:dTDP-4-dehydrorhamnose 3,5-epimerase
VTGSMLEVTETAIPAVRIVVARRLGDARGFFAETWNRDRFHDAGIDVDWVQENHAMSAAAGTVRGFHYQLPPAAQAKLIRVVRGAALDVAVDLRRGSPTFGRHVAIELSAENFRQLLIPIGFAHGYCTLEPDTEILYKVDHVYTPDTERGIRWDDPALAIDWPVKPDSALLSEKDRGLPTLADQPDLFEYMDFDFDFDLDLDSGSTRHARLQLHPDAATDLEVEVEVDPEVEVEVEVEVDPDPPSHP